MRTVALLLLLICGPLCAAPAPFLREPKPVALARLQPGRWVMTWCGCAWDVELWGDGTYRGRCFGNIVRGETWCGTWAFDPAPRVLSVCEASESGCIFRWSVTLDGALSGRMAGDGGGVRFVRR